MSQPWGRRHRVVLAVVLILGFAIGVVLVVVGGDDGTVGDPGPSSSTLPERPAPTPLPLEDVSQAAVQELTGLVVPASATDFLTARLDSDAQLDVTFVMPAASTAEFVAASGLPELVADQRVVTHSSPLWKLNPEEGAALSGTTDVSGTVDRAVELVDEADGTVRARIVITAA